MNSDNFILKESQIGTEIVEMKKGFNKFFLDQDGNYEWKVTAITKSGGVVYNSQTSSGIFQIRFEPVEAVQGVSRTNLITFD